MKIYVASSWRNAYQPAVVEFLREHGHEVYDFRNPGLDAQGFQWRFVDPEWQSWTPEEYRRALKHPAAEMGFGLDMEALRWCDACVLVQPAGTSSHLELGWAVGAGKQTAILFPFEGFGKGLPCPHIEPELMAKMAGQILLSADELAQWTLDLRMSILDRFVTDDGRVFRFLMQEDGEACASQEGRIFVVTRGECPPLYASKMTQALYSFRDAKRAVDVPMQGVDRIWHTKAGVFSVEECPECGNPARFQQIKSDEGGIVCDSCELRTLRSKLKELVNNS